MNFSHTLKNFFVVEGIDGSGKSSLISSLKDEIPSLRLEREPTYSELGKYIRQIISTSSKPFCQQTLLLLFTADRQEHIYGEKGIALKEEKEMIISDRYFFSTLAYQTHSKEEFDYALNLNGQFPLPEILFYLDISPEEALGRINQRKEDLQIFESLERLKKIKDTYEKTLLYFEKETNLTIIRLDASKNSFTLAKEVKDMMLSLYQRT